MIHIIQRIIQCAIGVLFIVLIIINWRYNHIGQNIINLLATSLFFAGLDNIVIFYVYYIDKNSF